MNVLRRLIYKEVVLAVMTVSVAFLGLFFFFDLIDELPAISAKHPRLTRSWCSRSAMHWCLWGC
jgi:lipopolysaccharide export LptBFGC system permease protein LptF